MLVFQGQPITTNILAVRKLKHYKLKWNKCLDQVHVVLSSATLRSVLVVAAGIPEPETEVTDRVVAPQGQPWPWMLLTLLILPKERKRSILPIVYRHLRHMIPASWGSTMRPILAIAAKLTRLPLGVHTLTRFHVEAPLAQLHRRPMEVRCIFPR